MERSSIFDMIGPVMIGPSSSHTAGVARIGRVAHKVLGETPDRVELTFYNSFATTYEGHGSDRAVLAGLMDMKTDDERIRNAMEIAKGGGIEIVMKSVMSASRLHPNTIRILASKGDRQIEILGISRGGGLITIAEVQGFHSDFTGQLFTLIVQAKDVKGSIAFITNIIAHDDCNIATMTVSRRARNDLACLIFELDTELEALTINSIRSLEWVREVVYISPID